MTDFDESRWKQECDELMLIKQREKFKIPKYMNLMQECLITDWKQENSWMQWTWITPSAMIKTDFECC